MKEEKALLAGEMSGHMFLAEEHFGYDDAVYAALEVCRVLARQLKDGKKGLSALLSDLPSVVSTPEIRTDCPEARKFQIVEALKKELGDHLKRNEKPLISEIIDIDGVRVVFEQGWGLVRASNTQPILVSRFEAVDEKNLEIYKSFFRNLVGKIAPELSFEVSRESHA